MRNCVVPTCKNRWPGGGVNKRYHYFPKEQQLREKWIRVVGMTREPSKHSNICSDHFKISDYTVTNYGDFPGPLRKGTVPSENLPHSKGSSTSNECAATFLTVKRNRVATYTLPVVEFVAVKSEPIDDDDIEETTRQEVKEALETNCSAEVKYSEADFATSDASTMAIPAVQSIGTQASFINLRISYNTVTDPELIYTTGFERSQFNLIFNKVETYAPIPENTTCIKKDSLLVTLFMLRHEMNFRMIEFIFGISRRTMSGVCNDLVDKLNCLVKREDIWDNEFRDSRPFRCLIKNAENYQNRKK